MSVLEIPRILFRGQVSWDPIVTNNYAKYYDENTSESNLPPASTTQQQVAAFRQEAIGAVVTGNWNPHGTHRSTFFDAEVTGVDYGNGLVTDDPFVGVPIDFTGMLVDLEPYGAFSSQLFFDSMTFGIPGGYLISCPSSARMTARCINFNRNSYNRMIAGVASVVWQTSFAKTDGLGLEIGDSPALEALAGALSDDDVQGLTVRWNSYRTIYYGDPTLRNGAPQTTAAAQGLTKALNAGGWQPNPARSLVVGVLGLWRQGEPVHEPGDRPLLAAQPSEVVASASARLDVARQTLTIDLGNSIAEVDELLSKQNLGTLEVLGVDRDGVTVRANLGTLAAHQYDRVAYEYGSGLVDVWLSPDNTKAAAGLFLQIRGSDGTVYLAETLYQPVPTEPNRYLNESDPPTTTTVQVYALGSLVPAGIDVTRYDATAGTPVEVVTVQTDQNGVATFPISPVTGGGVRSYVFVGGPNPVAPPQLDPQLTPYMYVRTLPADQATGNLAPTWDNVYTAVLANWNAMAPCMDNWLNLDDAVQVQAYAPIIKKLTDPSNFESFRFMPVTRDMTVGERTLLWNFLDAPLESPAPERALLQPDEPVTPPQRDLSKLSRAMRGN